MIILPVACQNRARLEHADLREQKALKDKGIDAMLDDARRMNVETDTEFLKKN